jgi:hypothetical protein
MIQTERNLNKKKNANKYKLRGWNCKDKKLDGKKEEEADFMYTDFLLCFSLFFKIYKESILEGINFSI